MYSKQHTYIIDFPYINAGPHINASNTMINQVRAHTHTCTYTQSHPTDTEHNMVKCGRPFGSACWPTCPSGWTCPAISSPSGGPPPLWAPSHCQIEKVKGHKGSGKQYKRNAGLWLQPDCTNTCAHTWAHTYTHTHCWVCQSLASHLTRPAERVPPCQSTPHLNWGPVSPLNTNIIYRHNSSPNNTSIIYANTKYRNDS